MSKIKYSCGKCTIWSTEIREEWGDLKPRRCMNKKCNCSFIAEKQHLLISKVEEKVDEVVILESKQEDNKKEKKDGKASNKSK